MSGCRLAHLRILFIFVVGTLDLIYFALYNAFSNCCSPMESKLATLSPTRLEVLLARPLRQVAAAAEVVATGHTIAQDSPCKYL